MSEVVQLKAGALRVRRAIEDVTRSLWAPVVGVPATSVHATSVARRLLLAVSAVPEAERRSAMRAAVKVGHVYAETSDVLHGRSRAAHYTTARVAEWEADLARLLELMPASDL